MDTLRDCFTLDSEALTSHELGHNEHLVDAGIPNPAERDQAEKLDRNLEEGIRLEITKVIGTLKKLSNMDTLMALSSPSKQIVCTSRGR